MDLAGERGVGPTDMGGRLLSDTTRVRRTHPYLDGLAWGVVPAVGSIWFPPPLSINSGGKPGLQAEQCLELSRTVCWTFFHDDVGCVQHTLVAVPRNQAYKHTHDVTLSQTYSTKDCGTRQGLVARPALTAASWASAPTSASASSRWPLASMSHTFPMCVSLPRPLCALVPSIRGG